MFRGAWDYKRIGTKEFIPMLKRDRSKPKILTWILLVFYGSFSVHLVISLWPVVYCAMCRMSHDVCVLVSEVADGQWLNLLPLETRDMWQLNWEIKQGSRRKILEKSSAQRLWQKRLNQGQIWGFNHVFLPIHTVKVPEEQKSDDLFNYWLLCTIFGLQCTNNLGCGENQSLPAALLAAQRSPSNVSVRHWSTG